MKFSKNVVTIGNLKVNPGKYLDYARESNTPILITRSGQGDAVIQNLSDFEDMQSQIEFMKDVSKGLVEVKEGKTIGVDEVKQRLGI